jgi:hypothetical protein
MKNIGFVLLLLVFLTACLPDEPTFENFRRPEVQRLLSNHDNKRWSLDERILFGETVSFNSCENPRQLIFNYTADTKIKDSLWYVNPADTCGNSTDTLKGYWFVPSTIKAETPIDTVVFIWEGTDTAYFRVENLTPVNFGIRTFFEEDSLRETFTHFPLPEEEEDN